LLLSSLIATALLSLIAAAAARLRYSASKGLRIALDILFFLPLLVPIEWISGTCRNIVLEEGGALLPFLYLCGILGFRSVERETIEAARLQGSGPCGIFWRVFWPGAWPWLLGGAAVLFTRLVLVVAGLIARMPRP
jgi:ABC-type Fe3+ transport system permease subunit